MNSIIIDNVSKSYGKVVAVKDLCLEIPDKEFLVLLGPSGCGKTTTLRLLAGLEVPDSGKIIVDGRDISKVLPKDRDFAMVFQSYALYPHMNVFDNMSFGLKFHGVNKEERAAKVMRTAMGLEIDHLLKRKPKELSGGQRQRVALGRAIVRNPRAFLMDEPLSNLDATLRSQMRRELVKIHKELGRTFIYVTHDQVEALEMSTQIAIMKDGELQQAGTPQEVYLEPANQFVKEFFCDEIDTLADRVQQATSRF
jgi:multiple sugar transport system ATP-binding protein